MRYILSGGLLVFFLVGTGILPAAAGSKTHGVKDRQFLKKFMADEAELKKNPRNADLNYEMGINYFLMDEFDQASVYFNKAMRLKPRDLDLRYRLGARYVQAGRIREALNYFKAALPLDRQNSLVHAEIGQIYFQMKKYQKALEHYREAAKWDPLYEEEFTLFQKKVVLDRKITRLKAALKKSPRDAIAHGKLADLYRKVGKEKAAIKHYRRAIRLDPNYKYFLPDDVEITQ